MAGLGDENVTGSCTAKLANNNKLDSRKSCTIVCDSEFTPSGNTTCSADGKTLTVATCDADADCAMIDNPAKGGAGGCGVAASITVLRATVGRDVDAILANESRSTGVNNNVLDQTAGASTQTSVTAILHASATLLARACDGGKDARTEFRVEDGFTVCAGALLHPWCGTRATADLCVTVAITVRDDTRECRRAIEAGCLDVLCEKLREASESLVTDASRVSKLRGDRDARDEAYAVCFAIAGLRVRLGDDLVDVRDVDVVQNAGALVSADEW